MKMNNIKSFKEYINEWHTIKRDKDGTITIDNDLVLTDDYSKNNIDRIVKRSSTTDMDKFCGGIKDLENKYDEIKELQPYDISLTDTISSQSNFGFVSLESTPELNNVFNLTSKGVGKGEVLLSRLYPDVKMMNRSDNEKGDCQIIKDNITTHHIEIKSGGSTFRYRDVPEDYENRESDDVKCAYSLASYLSMSSTGFFNDGKPLILICFDNEFINRKGETTTTGFLWFNCGVITNNHKEEKRKELFDKLMGMIDINTDGKGAITKEGERGFAISVNNEKIICHITKKSEV